MRNLQEIGALTPAVTAALAYLLMGAVETASTYAALIPVMLGVMIATGYEPSFHNIGFTAAVGGCVARAFKTVLQVPLKLFLAMLFCPSSIFSNMWRIWADVPYMRTRPL